MSTQYSMESIGTLDDVETLRAIEIARAEIRKGRTIREAACSGIDVIHGFTCEFASSYAQHVAEYDELETRLFAKNVP